MPARRISFDESYCHRMPLNTKSRSAIRPVLLELGFNVGDAYHSFVTDGVTFTLLVKHTPYGTPNLNANVHSHSLRAAMFSRAGKPRRDGTRPSIPHRTLAQALEGINHLLNLKRTGRLPSP